MRPRKKDRHLPPCIYLSHGQYFYVRGGKWRPLGRDLGTALLEHARLHSQPKGSMGRLIDDALADMRPRLSVSTVKQYTIAASKLKAILVEFSPRQVKPVDVVQIKKALAGTPNMGNRVLSFLRLVFDYALECRLVDSNPAIGVKRHPENKRGRLLAPAEFRRIREEAPLRLKVIMDLLYLTGQRVVDVLNIKRSDLLEDGIRFTQQKTGARLTVRWTPELRAAVDEAKALSGNVRAFTLLCNRKGKPPDYKSTYYQWEDACYRAGVDDAHLHDIRAMSLTAAQGQGKDATALAGHASPAMTERYLRDRQIPLVDGPIFGT